MMTEAKSNAAADAPVPGIYQHYKGPRYQVLGTSRHSETEEWLVVYQALYAEKGFWVRPLSLWLEPVEHAANGMQPRFALVTPNDISLCSITQSS